MRLCIRSHDLKPTSIEDLVYKVKRFGLDGLQLVAYKTFSDIDYIVGGLTKNRAQEIGTLLKKNDISVLLLGAYFNPVHSNKQKVQDCIQIFKEYIACATYFGTEYIASETGSYNDDKWTYNPLNRTEDALQAITAIFEDLMLEAKRHNACIAIEGASGHVCYDVKTLDRLYRNLSNKSTVQSPDAVNADVIVKNTASKNQNVKIIFDIYNFLDSENYGDYLDILHQGLTVFKDKILCFHIKDFIIKDGDLVQVPVGDGVIDFSAYLKIIKDYDQNSNLVFEGTPLESLEKSIRLVRNVWANA